MERAEQAAEFWAWIVRNQGRLRETDGKDRQALFDQLLECLQAFREDLFFEIGGFPGGTTELIITAEGKSDLFDDVRALVASAPALPGWKFIALKPAAGFDFVTVYEGARIDPKTSWFLPLASAEHPDRFGMSLACSTYDATRHDTFRAAAHVVVETALGELAAAERVHYIDVEATPEDPTEDGYIELPQLVAYLDWRDRTPDN